MGVFIEFKVIQFTMQDNTQFRTTTWKSIQLYLHEIRFN